MCMATVLVVAAALATRAAAGASVEPVHMFYYLWYGTPSVDGAWRHWDHEVLPHWTPHVNKRYPAVRSRPFRPPHTLHSPYYPMRGPYSSRDPALLRDHFAEIRVRAGCRVVVVSWWGRPDVPGATDTQGVSTDAALPAVLDAARDAGVGVAFHLEPYPGRNATSVALDLAYLHNRYGSHPGVFRDAARGGRPWVYMYDSYHTPPEEWARLLTPGGDLSVRGTARDAVFVALWLDRGDARAGNLDSFDGFYTYFASDGFSYGSSTANWRELAAWARTRGKVFVASIGPGYDDTRIRPWNSANTKPRVLGRNGELYFDAMAEAALRAGADVLSVTSYNEWGEGTQVEPAVARAPTVPPSEDGASELYGASHHYPAYPGGDPYVYLDRIKALATRMGGGGGDDSGSALDGMFAEGLERGDDLGREEEEVLVRRERDEQDEL